VYDEVHQEDVDHVLDVDSGEDDSMEEYNYNQVVHYKSYGKEQHPMTKHLLLSNFLSYEYMEQ
jgi:hypothetical protein